MGRPDPSYSPIIKTTMEPSRRLERVAELLKRELGEIIRREFQVSQVGLLNVNRVGVARDLKSAVVFMGFVGTKEQEKNAPALLQTHAARLQMQLGTNVRLKFTPQLKFVLDDSVEKGNRVLQILDEIHRPEPPKV